MVTAKLICVFIFAYAKSRFSQDAVHFMSLFQKLIHSETAIYDVLQDFFYHSKPLVRVAALEVIYIYLDGSYGLIVGDISSQNTLLRNF